MKRLFSLFAVAALLAGCVTQPPSVLATVPVTSARSFTLAENHVWSQKGEGLGGDGVRHGSCSPASTPSGGPPMLLVPRQEAMISLGFSSLSDSCTTRPHCTIL